MKKQLWVGKIIFKDGKKFTAQAVAENKDEAKLLINKIILHYYPFYELKRLGVLEYKLYRAVIKDKRIL